MDSKPESLSQSEIEEKPGNIFFLILIRNHWEGI